MPVSGPSTTPRARDQRLKRRRRRRAAIVALLATVGLFTVLAVTLIVLPRSHHRHPGVVSTTATPTPKPARSRIAASAPLRLVERARGSLSAAVQDPAMVALGGGRVMLLGGLSAGDLSVSSIHTIDAGGDHQLGFLPVAVHDSAAVRLGPAVYLFGGGTNTGTQSDAIVRVSTTSGKTASVGRLPAPSSDQAAAVVDGRAYVVGGYTGSRWLDTIVAWKPGSAARVVAHLPVALRYAAVTAVRNTLVIAGGSLENGTATSEVLAYSPGRGVRRIGTLPHPTTHAAAAAIGDTAFVIGGRSATVGDVAGSIVAIDLRTDQVRLAGTLRAPRSDLGAASYRGRILLAGGRGRGGTVATISELVPRAAHATPTGRTRSGAAPSVYRYDGANRLTGPARSAKPLVYVPNSQGASVDVIDPRTYKVVAHYPVGLLPQHVVPSYDLSRLYVTNDVGNSLTVIDPRTGRPGRTIPVNDPYNMYFTPNGRYAIVVAERAHDLDFRNAHTFALHHRLSVPCAGVDHMDFSADGRFLIASCEFSGQLIKVDVARERVAGVLDLPDGRHGMPQDVRVSPDGKVFYVADLTAGGVWKINGQAFKSVGLIHTGAGAHGLYPSRDGRELYVSNRDAGSVSVISFRTQKVVATWRLPGGGSPDMGGVSANGRVLWLSGRYNSVVYAISTASGRLVAKIPVGSGPHGLCVWPQPGRYSLGHTDNMR